ncbi:MAG: hypothetical protein AAFQ87_21460 [Bacteroidota bacterium]
MKTALLSLCLLCLLSSMQANSYLSYYQLCHQGSKAHYFEQYEEGLQLFQEAFASVPFAHAEYLRKAAGCASQTDRPKLAYQYIKQSILQGSKEQFWKETEFETFRGSPSFAQLKDSLDDFKAQFQANTNQAYIALIDSLYYVDQRIIRKNRTVKGKYQIDKSKLPEDLYDLDASLFATLLSLIDQYGYPSERNVGLQAYRKADIIVHHNLRLTENESHTPLFEQALFAGEYSPISYALMMDQRNVWFQQVEPYFYYSKAIPEDMPAERIAEIERRRKDYGVPPIEAISVTKHRKFTRTVRLW